MGLYYETYRARLRKIADRLPDKPFVHFKPVGEKKRCDTMDDFMLYLFNAVKERKRRVIEYINPQDLELVRAETNLVDLLLLCLEYSPAYRVAVRDPETHELIELTEEEERALSDKLANMTPEEEKKYWEDEERRILEPYPGPLLW